MKRSNSDSVDPKKRAKTNDELIADQNSKIVFLEFMIGMTPAGRIEIELFEEIPIAAENFRALCTGEKGRGFFGELSYNQSLVYKRIRTSYVEGGDIVKNDGTGGESIYGVDFTMQEVVSRKHDSAGLISLAKICPNTYNSRFTITLEPCPELDGVNLVIGRLVGGLDVLQKFAMTSAMVDNSFTKKIAISKCGQVSGSSFFAVNSRKNEPKSLRSDAFSGREPSYLFCEYCGLSGMSDLDQEKCPTAIGCQIWSLFLESHFPLILLAFEIRRCWWVNHKCRNCRKTLRIYRPCYYLEGRRWKYE
jgi:cyclophilin family peptidyl-prolyl cis-trans isomerase